MPAEPPSRPSWRLDAVAFTLIVAAFLVAVCVFSQPGSDPDAIDTENLFGPPGEWLAGQLLDSVGLGVYVLLETFRWLERQGGLAAMERRNAEKAALIYEAIDRSGGYYVGIVAAKEQRSHMNVTFRLPTPELDDAFVKQAEKLGTVALKGYRTVGGIRASIYNAMPVEGCSALAKFMAEFASRNPIQAKA